MSLNLRAFLYLIRWCEGTAGEDGYRMLFGGELFDGFAQHPNRKVTKVLGGKPITSTAAGAYQFLFGTWEECRKTLNLPDFSPESQDKAAVYLIKRRGALDDVEAGRLKDAIRKCALEWASLPGSPYGQPTKWYDECERVYLKAGGALATAEPPSAGAQAPAEPPQPTNTTQPEAPMAPFIAAAIPALLQAAPDLIRIFGKGERSERNAQAAEKVAQIARAVTGEPTVEGAVGAIQTNPELTQKFQEAVRQQWFDLLDMAERVQKSDQEAIREARTFNAGEPFLLDTPFLKLRFVHLLSLILVGFSGWFAISHWADLTGELRGAIITLMVIAGWNGVRDYWMGSSEGSNRKTEMMRRER